MSIFRKHKSIVDRAASDRARHKKKIEKENDDIQKELDSRKPGKSKNNLEQKFLCAKCKTGIRMFVNDPVLQQPLPFCSHCASIVDVIPK